MTEIGLDAYPGQGQAGIICGLRNNSPAAERRRREVTSARRRTEVTSASALLAKEVHYLLTISVNKLLHPKIEYPSGATDMLTRKETSLIKR